jgi:hypothetical protein
MVVRNSALRMQGLSVGGWRDVLDPERLRMDIVKNLHMSIADNAMRKGEERRDEMRRSKRLKMSKR